MKKVSEWADNPLPSIIQTKVPSIAQFPFWVVSRYVSKSFFYDARCLGCALNPRGWRHSPLRYGHGVVRCEYNVVRYGQDVWKIAADNPKK